MTNFEKIKAMTADEMAEWIDKNNEGCTMCIYETSSCESSFCIKGRKIWLMQEDIEDKLVKASDTAEHISLKWNIPLQEVIDIFAEMPDMRLCASDGKVGDGGQEK